MSAYATDPKNPPVLSGQERCEDCGWPLWPDEVCECGRCRECCVENAQTIGGSHIFERKK